MVIILCACLLQSRAYRITVSSGAVAKIMQRSSRGRDGSWIPVISVIAILGAHADGSGTVTTIKAELCALEQTIIVTEALLGVGCRVC